MATERIPDNLLIKLANDIEPDEQIIKALGLKLGFTMAAIDIHGRSRGPQLLNMLSDWREHVDPSDQHLVLKQALIDAKLVMLAGKHFEGTPSIPDSTDPYQDITMDAIPFDSLTEYEPGRSYVLFINNIFTGKMHRKGAEVDEENIKKLFEHKGYYLHYEKNVYLSELQDCMKLVKRRLEKGCYKNFIFIIGTHGGPTSVERDKRVQDTVLMADEEPMPVKDIISYFHGDQIPAMNDKPKVFIIQSCRGGEMQTSVHSSDNAETVSNQKTKNYPQPDSQPAYRPVNSDILIAYATSEGTKAFRNATEGSWFVEELCQVIREYSDKENMLDILVRVNGLMVRREGETSDQEPITQMPCFLCTFTRRFMLKYPTK